MRAKRRLTQGGEGDFRKRPECGGDRNTQTTTFMQEAGGRGAYYVVGHNVQVGGISIGL